MAELPSCDRRGRRRATIAVESEDPALRDRGRARARPRLAPERLLAARAQGARRLRRAPLRRHRRRHELGQVPRRRAARGRQRGARSSTAPRSRGSARASTTTGRLGAEPIERTVDAIAGDGRRGDARTASRRSPRSARPGCGSRRTAPTFVDAVRERAASRSRSSPARRRPGSPTSRRRPALGRRRRLARRLRHRRRQLAVHVRPRRRASTSGSASTSAPRASPSASASTRVVAGRRSAAALGRDRRRPRAPRRPAGARHARRDGRRGHEPRRRQARARDATTRTSSRARVLDRAEIDRQIELYRTPHRRRAARDRRAAAEARRGHPRRRLHRPHRAREARPRLAHVERPRPAARPARRAVRATAGRSGGRPGRIGDLRRGSGSGSRAGLLTVRGDGRVERREEVRRVDRPGQLVALDLAPHRILHLGEDQRDALRVDRLVEAWSMSAAVVSTSVIGSAATMIHARRADRPTPAADLVAERPRVGEEQRRVEPEDDAARQQLGVGVAAHVVVAGHARRRARAPSGTATTRAGTR